jgi:hypothetical protein
VTTESYLKRTGCFISSGARGRMPKEGFMKIIFMKILKKEKEKKNVHTNVQYIFL